MHAQIKTLTLMAAVLAAIVVYAVIPKEVTLGSYTLKKITFSSIFHHAPQEKKTPKEWTKNPSKPNYSLHWRLHGRGIITPFGRLLC